MDGAHGGEPTRVARTPAQKDALEAADGNLVVGTCPMVVPDGQPCTVASTCDTFAQCFQGTCTLLDGVVCR
jgi:hypothetical protein